MRKIRYISKNKFWEYLQALIAYLMRHYLDVEGYTPRKFQEVYYSHHVTDLRYRDQLRPCDEFSESWKEMVKLGLRPSETEDLKDIVLHELLCTLIHACVESGLTPQQVKLRYKEETCTRKELLGYRAVVNAAFSREEKYRYDILFYSQCARDYLPTGGDFSQLQALAKILGAIAWDYARAMDEVAIINHPNHRAEGFM